MSNKGLKTIMLGILLIAVLTVSCSSKTVLVEKADDGHNIGKVQTAPQETATATPPATATPEPTLTPAPTATPEPATTPEPTQKSATDSNKDTDTDTAEDAENKSADRQGGAQILSAEFHLVLTRFTEAEGACILQVLSDPTVTVEQIGRIESVMLSGDYPEGGWNDSDLALWVEIWKCGAETKSEGVYDSVTASWKESIGEEYSNELAQCVSDAFLTLSKEEDVSDFLKLLRFDVGLGERDPDVTIFGLGIWADCLTDKHAASRIENISQMYEGEYYNRECLEFVFQDKSFRAFIIHPSESSYDTFDERISFCVKLSSAIDVLHHDKTGEYLPAKDQQCLEKALENNVYIELLTAESVGEKFEQAKLSCLNEKQLAVLDPP